MNTSLSSLLHLQGLPPLPRSLTSSHHHHHHPNGSSNGGYSSSSSQLHQQYMVPSSSSPQHFHHNSPHPISHHGSSHPHNFVSKERQYALSSGGRPSPPVPPPRPHSRRSSSSGSSFRASPEHLQTTRGLIQVTDVLRSSPRSLSSSPHSPHIDSGFGRSSADSFSDSRAFVRVVKSPQPATKLDAQLSQLRKDMQHLRQQDMQLLGHLLQINQGIQELKNVLVPPPQPAPTVPLPMFNSTPGGLYVGGSSSSSGGGSVSSIVGSAGPIPPSRQNRKMSQGSRTSRLFGKRGSSDSKLMSDHELAALGACGGMRVQGDDEDSGSLSSVEFCD